MGAQAVRLSNIDIDNALKNKDFEVIFQPVFDLGNGALARVEAFVRWRHPSLGLLPPGAFISFFESQGRMSELTRYVLNQALSHYLAWRGASAPGFSINLALSDLADEAFASHFSVLLRDRNFPADLITLECPMPPVTMPIATAAEHFRRLAATGARLAIEVRGRANDFLRMIEPFPFDEIKTGGAAILRFARTVRGPGLSAISELIDIANNANAAITAVGVEDQASLAALRSLGFAAAQGNHLGRVGALQAFEPVRVNEVRKLLGLEPLSNDDLNSLFRTEAPSLQQPLAAEIESETTAEAERRDEQDSLVKRLAARLARRDKAQAPAAEEAAIANEAGPASESAAAAPKPKLAAAKAAAIARARRKAAERANSDLSGDLDNDSDYFHIAASTASEPSAARDLQERLAEEFGALAEEEAPPAPTPGPTEADDEFNSGFFDDDAEPNNAALAAVDLNANEEAAPEATDVDGAEADADAVEFVEPQAAAAAGGSSGGRFIRASLAVGRTGAYFRPGMRVGAAAPLSPPREYPAPAKPVAAESLTADAGAIAEAGDPAPAATAEPVVADAPEQRRRTRRKNFLTRKYRVWPTHFWPRGLKRLWQKRKAARVQPAPEAAAGV